MFQKFSSQIASMVAVIVLTLCATAGAMLFVGKPGRVFVPLVFTILTIGVAVRFGAIAGIAGSLIGAAVFASLLFPPVGTLKVEDAAARSELGWMLLAGISLSYLLAGPALPGDKKQLK